jgi:hypothetical protein
MNKFSILCVSSLLLVAACSKVEAAGSSGKKLSLTAPANQSLRQGDTNDVAIKVDRTSFDGPVAIEFSQLPAGVTVSNPGSIPSGDEMRSYTLAVAPTATPVEKHRITVTASALDMRVQQSFEVSLKAR